MTKQNTKAEELKQLGKVLLELPPDSVIKHIVPQYHEIVKSHSKKMNLGKYLPESQYESEDFFSSHKETIPLEEASPEKIKEVGDRLLLTCIDETERQAYERINDLRKEVGLPMILRGKDMQQIADVVTKIELSKTKEELQAIGDEIKATKESLNVAQLDYLRRSIRTAAAKIK